MISRRKVLLVASATVLAAPRMLLAQEAQPRVPRVGFLGATSPTDMPKNDDAFLAGLRERGYVPGRTIHVEYRWAGGQAERFPALAAELASSGVDVIFAITSAATTAAAKTARSTPIVFVGVSDPVGYGFVASLAQPGGNLTGMALQTPELNEKRLELLKEAAAGGLSRVAVLWNPGFETHEQQLRDMEAGARALNLQIQPVGLAKPEEIGPAFATITKGRADGVMILASSFNHRHLRAIAAAAAMQRLPSICETSDFSAFGGLLTYGPSWPAMFRQAATLIDKILKGAKPASLPVERPTTIELVINLKTAHAIGMRLPQSLLVRAERVIE